MCVGCHSLSLSLSYSLLPSLSHRSILPFPQSGSVPHPAYPDCLTIKQKHLLYSLSISPFLLPHSLSPSIPNLFTLHIIPNQSHLSLSFSHPAYPNSSLRIPSLSLSPLPSLLFPPSLFSIYLFLLLSLFLFLPFSSSLSPSRPPSPSHPFSFPPSAFNSPPSFSSLL
jgi:hypothetical protein